MRIVLSKTEIEVHSIRPTADGLTIDVVAENVADIEKQITPEHIETIRCVEGDTTFALYKNQQLISLYKDSEGVHIKTRYKTLPADKDVSKQLSDLQNTILSMQNELTSVQSVQDIQNSAIAEIGNLVSQNIETDMDDLIQEEGQE